MKCCDRPVTTPYCPYCGSVREEGPLFRLLDHCRLQLSKATQQVEKWQTLIDTDQTYEHGERYTLYTLERFTERARIIEDKWRSWVNDLTALLEKEVESKSGSK